MQIVNILGHHADVVFLLQGSHQLMPPVGLRLKKFSAEHVVEVIHVVGICLPGLMGCHSRHGIVLP